ncbi:MAG: NADH-quinone oxidoreductase subunit N [Gammaproteobacteria bacterium]|nr:NADH-quinone oxidoreductase subunit N [Gammaproteobacteria bacterium]
MTITLDDLIPLFPLLAATLTVVLAMVAVGIKRSYLLAAVITVGGLLIATVCAFGLLPGANFQVTPLLIIDEYSLFFTGITSLTAILVALLSYPYFADLDDHKEEYFLLLGLATVGAIVMVSSNHYVSAILGIETLSMSLYGMVAYPSNSDKSVKFSLEASVKYLILSAAASGFMLFGIALIYAQTGTLAFESVLAVEETPGLTSGFTIAALILLFVGVAFKLSLAPFHMWTPDVYEGAPLPATTYLATVGKMAMFIVFLRLVMDTQALQLESITFVISMIAVVSMLVGNLLALLQSNLKRILAYSSIAHMGYLLIAVVATYMSSGSVGIEAITFYLIAYVIMSLGAFGVASVISSSTNEFDGVEDYTGLFWRNPILAALFTGMLLSLAGIPLTVGFVGKFYIFFAGVESELWLLIGALIIGSGIGLYYYLRVIYIMILPREQRERFDISASQDFAPNSALLFLSILMILFGIYPAPLISIIEDISTFVL